MLDSKDINPHLFQKEDGEKLVKEMIAPELTSAITRTVKILQRAEDNITAFVCIITICFFQ